MDQKTYLQKYLSSPLVNKKKKRKKVVKGNGFKIIDDDIDLSKMRSLNEDEVYLLDEGEDGPQIAGIIDERPAEIQNLEQFKTSTKWRVVTQQIEKSNDSDDSDLSPPRVRRRSSESPTRKSKKVHVEKRYRQSSSDLSPPRKEKNRNVHRDAKHKYNDSPPPSNKKMERTLDGKKAGLQDARQLRDENEAFRRREDEAFSKMTDDVSGRNASAVSRKANKRETSEERRKQMEKAKKQKELDEKYRKWSRGLKQLETQEARRRDFIHEASKPLARHTGDRDLEHSLRQAERHGDPMLRYVRDKKRERGDLGPEKPMYRGNFPPNRFNIRPGYRWDGVDRSNGYEKKFFEHQSKRKAQEEEAYKWSTEDL
ncbi:hypothetical protein ACJJTC_011436 [Scirpophaga incertulas]